MKVPAVSVIIPMFNAEKFIGECLESIFLQTFQDFEVIVVDDCSTDNSVAVVESFSKKFGGRLKIARTKKNSGSPGEPGNFGVDLSRGEYLSVLDNDDAITPTALEELYFVAKKFDADVVACEKYFSVPENFWKDDDFRKKLCPTSYPSIDFVSEPTLIPFDAAERVQLCFNRKFLWTLWSKLIRRDFLIENEILFADNLMQDMLATCCMVYSAEKFVRVPNVINFYREREDSLWHNVDEPKKFFKKYIRALTTGFNHLEKFLNGRKFFKQNPEMKRLVLETYVREISAYLDQIYATFPAYELDEILQKEFSKTSNAALLAFVFSSMNFYRLKLLETLRRTAQLEKIGRQDKAYISELEKFVAKLLE